MQLLAMTSVMPKCLKQVEVGRLLFGLVQQGSFRCLSMQYISVSIRIHSISPCPSILGVFAVPLILVLHMSSLAQKEKQSNDQQAMDMGTNKKIALKKIQTRNRVMQSKADGTKIRNWNMSQIVQLPSQTKNSQQVVEFSKRLHTQKSEETGRADEDQ